MNLIYGKPTHFYVYAYLRENGSPYYIGKGKSSRILAKHGRIHKPIDKTKIIFLETNLTELGAFALERRYIAWYGRKDKNTGILRNLTDGGEGQSGAIVSKETRELQSKIRKGKKKPPMSEIRKKMVGDQHRGKKDSLETREKKSKSQTGRKHKERTLEQKLATGSAMRGKHHSKESREQMSKTRKGKKKPEGFGDKISKANKGKTASDSTKELQRTIRKEHVKINRVCCIETRKEYDIANFNRWVLKSN